MSYKPTFVNIAQIKTRRSPCVLSSILGSCVGIVLYDKDNRIGSLAHAMLPTIKKAHNKNPINPKKFVDSSIDIQLKEMVRLGANKKQIVAKLVGGASMFETFIENPIFNIGKRNMEVAMNVLQKENIKIVAKDLGKNSGRTIEFYLRDGSLRIFHAKGALDKRI